MNFTNEELQELAYNGNYLNREVSENFLVRNLASELLDKRLSDGWISVKDRLPEKNKWVLTYPNPYGSGNQFNYPECTLAYLNINSVWVNSTYSKRQKDPTHWMPLPEPPESEDE